MPPPLVGSGGGGPAGPLAAPTRPQMRGLPLPPLCVDHGRTGPPRPGVGAIRGGAGVPRGTVRQRRCRLFADLALPVLLLAVHAAEAAWLCGGSCTGDVRCGRFGRPGQRGVALPSRRRDRIPCRHGAPFPALRAIDKARDGSKPPGSGTSTKRSPAKSSASTEADGGIGIVAGVLRGVFRDRANKTTTKTAAEPVTAKTAPSSDRASFHAFPRLLGKNATNVTSSSTSGSLKTPKEPGASSRSSAGRGDGRNNDTTATAERSFWWALWRRQPEGRLQQRDRELERIRTDRGRAASAAGPRDRAAPPKGGRNDEARQDKGEARRRRRVGAVAVDQPGPEGAPWPLAALGLIGNGTVANRTKASNETASGNALAVFSRLFNGTTSANTTAKSANVSNSGGNPLTGIQRFFSSSSSLLLSAASSKEEWVTVLPKTRLMPGVIVPVTVAGLDLLVVASKDGRRLYAIENSCSHLGTPLETGQLVRLPIESDVPAFPKPSSSSSSSSSPASSSQVPDSQFAGKLSGAFNGPWSEKDVSNMLQQDGCEDCIVCPLHKTAFALQSGAVRGEWCPYPPVLGKLIGNIKAPTGIAVFDIRTRGKNVEVRINTPITIQDEGTNS